MEKEIRNLVKNVNNISFSSQDKIKDFIYNQLKQEKTESASPKGSINTNVIYPYKGMLFIN